MKKHLLSLLFLLLLPVTAEAQTTTTMYRVDTIAALKAIPTSRPPIVIVMDVATGGQFEWGTTPCSAADDVFQVTPTSGPTGCWTRMANVQAVGKASPVSSVMVSNGSGTPAFATTLPAVNGSAVTSLSPGNMAYTQAGTGGTSRTQTQRNATHLSDTEYGTQVQAYNQAVATAVPLLQAPSYNVGSVCGYPVATDPCVGGSAVKGWLTGNIAIGNYVSGTDAFVAARIDNEYTNVNQEMRGVSVAIRNTRSTADEPTLGWDSIPLIGTTVVSSTNTQNIVGNMKAVVAEHIFEHGGTNYSVKNTYGIQSTLVTLATGVTLTDYQGVIVSATPTGGGTITTGYGVQIGAITATTAAAIKLDGTGNAGRILWNAASILESSAGHMTIDFGAATSIAEDTNNKLQIDLGTTAFGEDSSGKMTFNFNSQLPVFTNPLTATTVGAAGGATALPATPTGYWRVLLGGNEYKIPFYAP